MLQNPMIAVISLLIAAIVASAKYIQVPAVVNDDTLSLRLNQMHRVSSVFHQFGQLKRIFKKEVSEIVEGNEMAFPTCYEQMPYALLEAQSSIYVGSGSNTNGLVYDFDKMQSVKNRRNLIDIEMTDKNIFYAREDGYIRMVSITSGSLKMSIMKQFRTNEAKLTKGNIVVLSNAIYYKSTGCAVFINHNQAALFNLEGDNFTQLEGFVKMKDFESAIPVEDKYLAAAYGQEGVVIYSLDFNSQKLIVEAKFNKDNLGMKTLNIKDLAYDHVRKLLFLLDHNSGVLPLQVILSRQGLQAQLTSSVIKNNYCNLIYYDSFTEQLYLNCRELIKYHINNWPVLDLKVLPRQEISVRSISSAGGSVVLAGRNVLQIIAQERKVAVYEDKLLQKFILKDKIFLSANEHYLLLGTYEIVPPQISCQSSNLSQVGHHKLLFKVTAECNVQYFNSIGFNPGQIFQDDKCVYSVYQTVDFWQAKELNIQVFLYILGAIVLLGLGLLIWWGISGLRLKKLRNYVQHYQTLQQQQSQKANPNKNAMVVELSPAISAEEGKNKNGDKPDTIQIGEQLHDIE